MKIAIELFAIWTAFSVALALQAIYAAQQRELHELHKQGFGAGLHPQAETETTALIPPPFKGSVVSDNSARLS
jgi:hypothetical protein